MGELSETTVLAHLERLGPLESRELTAENVSRVCSRVIESAFQDLEHARGRLEFRSWDSRHATAHDRERMSSAALRLRSAVEFVSSDRLEGWAAGTTLSDRELTSIRKTFLARARPLLGELVSQARRRGLKINGGKR